MKQFLKNRWQELWLACMCAGGLYWLNYNTSWHYASSSESDKLNPPVQYFEKQNGATATVWRFPCDDVQGLKASLDRSIFRWAQQRMRESECYISPLPAAYATAFISTGKTRRVIMYVAGKQYVDWIKMDFPNSSNYTGELNQFLRTEMKWKGSIADFQPVKNDFIPYSFPIEQDRVIELPRELYSVGEQVGMAPMFRTSSEAHLLNFVPKKVFIELFASNNPQNAVEEEMKSVRLVAQLRKQPATSTRCSTTEYIGGEKKEVGWIFIFKGTKKCVLIVRRKYYDSTDVLAGGRLLAEHLAREWAKLPD